MEGALAMPHVASLLADPARATIVWTLIDGTARPAGDLAFAANISPQSASGHLAKLVDGGLLAAEAQGRHRYFRIASADVASAIECFASLGSLFEARAPRGRSPSPAVPAELVYARTCYGHLAGEIAVKVLAKLLQARWLTEDGRGYAVTRLGNARLGALGIDLEAERRRRRVFARPCLDVTQRRPHLSGSLGDALLQLYIARGWIRRQRRTRAVSVTPSGRQAFRTWFGI
jgi:DNA-binding transcriptional ArsR family regulator